VDASEIQISFIADVFGRPGRTALSWGLERLHRRAKVDFVVANAENAAGGFGVTPRIATGFLDQGIDVLTSGNHVWDKREIYEFLDVEPRLLRPDNYPAPNPGSGIWMGDIGGVPGAVINLQGRVFMRDLDCPFTRLDAILATGEMAGRRIVIVDFHAEATAEKIAFGRYADGRVTAVIGTHTHVPTADAVILPGGTGYMTDAGMTGPHGGVIGVEADEAIERFRLQTPNRFSVSRSDVRFQGLSLSVDRDSGRTTSIEPFDDACG
jgi:metallophosphoesterase (TIGR00282 family)